ncbi:MAG: TIR domain-containing protein [Clostridia bacterium]
MKGKVFIGWSPEITLAREVAIQLREKEYKGIVGGREGDCCSSFVGQTVINQLKECNQAILLFQRKDKNISGNLWFELGYTMARYDTNKTHVFYIDICKKDGDIPSNLQGLWSEEIVSTDKDTVKLAEEIVALFEKRQKLEFLENKMGLVNRWDDLKHRISNHSVAHFYSDYEIAMCVLLYTQSAYMFDMAKDATRLLTEFNKNNNQISKELSLSLSIASHSLRLFEQTKREGDNLLISMIDYYNLEKDYRKALEGLNQIYASEFKTFAELMIKEHLTYLYILVLENPEVLQLGLEKNIIDKNLVLLGESLTLCDKMLEEETDKGKSFEFITLFKCYIHRNCYITLERLKLYNNDVDEHKILYHVQASFEERRELLNSYRNKNIDSNLYDNFQMEYYLSLSEYLKYAEGEDRKILAVELAKYIEQKHSFVETKNHYIKKMRILLKELTED